MSHDREEALFAAHRGNPSRASLVALLTAHQNRIYNICFQVLAHPEDAEDASQEVLIEAARCLPKINDARAFKAWLYQVALTTSLGIRRSRARRAELARHALTPASSGAPAMDRAERDAFMQAIAELDDETRGLLLEHYFEKTTLEELGRREGVSTVAIWKRLEKAKLRLKQELFGAGFAVAAAGVANSLDSIPPMTAPALLVTEAVLGKATLVAVGGAAMSAKSAISGGMIVAVLAIAGAAGSGGYLIGSNRVARQQAANPATENLAERQSVAPADRGSATPRPIAIKPALSTEITADSDKGRLRERVLETLRSLKGEWRVTYGKAVELTRLDPDVVIGALREVWAELAVEDQQQILKAFAMSEFRYILDVLDVAMQDPPNESRSWAAGYLKAFSFQEFGADQAAYLEWRKSVLGKSLSEAAQQSARAFVDRLGGASPAQAKEMFELLRNERNKVTIQALLDAGYLDVAERLLANSSAEEQIPIFLSLREMPLDEGFLRRNVVPYLAQGGEKPVAFHLMGRRQNAWAVDVLLPHLQSTTWGVVTGSAEALGNIGDPRSIPFLIEAMRRNPERNGGYDIGYFALGKLTGVKYDQSHDAAWWTDWWQKNQNRFVGQK